MKSRNLLICGILSVALGACSYEPDEMVVEVDQSYPIQLFNEIDQVATTRVNDEGFCDGDGVGIYVVNYDGGLPGQLVVEGNQADNVRYVYDEANSKWIPDESVYFRDKNTHVDIIGYYPYGSPSSVDAYAFEVAKDQSTEAANGLLGGYEASDFLWGKAADIAPTSQRIAVKFQHRMAGVLVTLTEGTGFDTGEFVQLEKSVLVTNTIRKAVIDLSTGEVLPTGEVPTTGTVPYKRDGDFRAVVVPQTVAASTPLFSITVDGVPYVFRKSEPFSYVGGKLHKFAIEVSKKSASGLEFKLLGESITAWETDNISHDATAREYIIVDCPEPGTLKECITAAGKDYTKVKNLKVTGTIDQRDFEMMRTEMTALQSEYEGAVDEGVKFNWESNIVEILDYNGVLSGVVIECNGEKRIEKADKVLMAVGSVPASRIVSTTKGIDVNEHGYVLTRENPYGMTSRKGVFAGGDVVNQPSTVVLAMHDAKLVAEGIAKYVDAVRLLQSIDSSSAVG